MLTPCYCWSGLSLVDLQGVSRLARPHTKHAALLVEGVSGSAGSGSDINTFAQKAFWLHSSVVRCMSGPMCHLYSLHRLTSLQIISEVKAWLVTPPPVFEQPHFSTLSLGHRLTDWGKNGSGLKVESTLEITAAVCGSQHLTLRPHPAQQVFLTDDQYYLDVIVVSGLWPELQHPIRFHTVGAHNTLMGLKSTDTFFTRHHGRAGAFLSMSSGGLCWLKLLSSLWHCCL